MPTQEPDFPRIWAKADIMGGVPCIRGTRIPVYIVVGKLGYGMSIDELLREYPALSREDVLEALRFAARAVECPSRVLSAVLLFSSGTVGSGRAAALAGMTRIEFLELLGRLGIPIADYPPEEVGPDVETMQQEDKQGLS